MRKKIVAALLATAMVATALIGCGSSNTPAAGNTQTEATNNSTGSEAAGTAEETQDTASGEVIELEFWGWWSSEHRKPHIEAMVQGFNESQDQYHVTYVDIPFGDIFTKNIAQIAAGSPCDIIANNMEEVAFRAEQDQVEPLDAFVTDDVKNAFYEQYLDSCTGDDGSLYALPLSVDTRAVYYNKAHFEEVGIKAEDIVTWDDLVAAARKLDVKNGDSWDRVGFLPILGNGGLNLWVINANSGLGWFDTETLEATINTDTNKDVFKWIREQIEYYGQAKYDELSAVFTSGMQDPFASGAMSMLVQTSSYKSALANNAPDLDYGVMKIPEYKPGTGRGSNGGGFVLEVPKGAKNPEASYAFIEYVTSKETQDFLSTKIGDFSARNDFDDTTEFFQNPINKDLAECLNETYTVIVPNKLKGYQEVVDPLLEEGTLGVTSPDKALENAHKAFEDFLLTN